VAVVDHSLGGVPHVPVLRKGRLVRTSEDDDEGTAAAEISAVEAEGVDDADDQSHPDDEVVGDAVDYDKAAKRSIATARLTTYVGPALAVVLTAVVSWLGFQAYQSHQSQERRQLFVQVGRQTALNLSTIDWHQADSDVERILNSITGSFYDDFAKKKQPFVELVKKAQSKSAGTIVEAGLESESGDVAQVMVAVSVKTSDLGSPDQVPQEWRMRLSLHKIGDEAKVSKVEFTP
jgi:Mce-associated membrane protein